MLPFSLLGLGAGLSFLPLTTIAVADVPIADAGLASGILNASQQISVAIGTAALATVAAERTKALAGPGQHHLEALPAVFTSAGRSPLARSLWAHHRRNVAAPAAEAGVNGHRAWPRAGRVRA